MEPIRTPTSRCIQLWCNCYSLMSELFKVAGGHNLPKQRKNVWRHHKQSNLGLLENWKQFWAFVVCEIYFSLILILFWCRLVLTQLKEIQRWRLVFILLKKSFYLYIFFKPFKLWEWLASNFSPTVSPLNH